jgi:error-prone DNA polymerase
VLDLAARLEDAPRHLGIHSGGMVLSKTPVSEVVPIEWARIQKRSILQWDKERLAD